MDTIRDTGGTIKSTAPGPGTAVDVAGHEPASFGEWLHRRRRALDLTQEELAARAGCARSTVKRIEADDLRPSKELARALAAQLGLTREESEAFAGFARGAGSLPLPPLPAGAVPAPAPAAARAPVHLPHPLSSLIGREREVESLRQILAGGMRPSRLVTLTGPGGVGKTSLAIAVAAGLGERFPHGIFFVDLAPLTEAGLVMPTIAYTLGIGAAGSRPPEDVLREYLQDRQVLLLLDNFEHLMPAAALVSAKLASCPHLHVLVTSRERLRLRGERTFYVPPLGLPDRADPSTAGWAGRSAAVDLFVERAQELRPDFALTEGNAGAIAEICTRLDGLPLAIELAAAQLSVFSPQQLLLGLDRRLPVLTSRTRDAPPRHASLQAVLGWSYDLLDPAEKALFCQASVFAGSWSLEAADAVCAVSAAEPAAREPLLLDLHLRLVEKSLFTTEEQNGLTRYRMLRTLAGYAGARMAESGRKESLEARFLDYCVRLAEAGASQLDGAGQSAWLVRLDLEHDNLRAALGLAAERGDHEHGLRLAGALARFWEVRGYFAEGRRHLARALDLAPRDKPGLAGCQAKAFLGAATLARLQTDFGAAGSAVEESLALWRSLRDARGICSALLEMGTLCWFQGDYGRALVELEHAQTGFAELGDSAGLRKTLAVLGRVHERQGDYDAARALLEESLALAREREDLRAVAVTLSYLGAVSWYCGETVAARYQLEESLALSRDLRDREAIVEVSLYLANVHRSQGNYERARELHEQALSLAQEIGNMQRVGYALFNLGLDAHHLGDDAAAQVLAERSLALFLTLGDRRGMARASETLGMALSAGGDLAAGRAQHEASLGLSRDLGDRGGIAHSLIRLAGIACRMGDLPEALRLLRESQDQFESRDNMGLVLPSLVVLAAVAGERGDQGQAARLAGCVDALLRKAATALEPLESDLYERAKTAARRQLGEAAFASAWADGAAMDQASLAGLLTAGEGST